MRMITVPTEELMDLVLLQLEKGGVANLTVTGSSMLPMLREYWDSVILAPLNRKLRPGDIALYRNAAGDYILHRLIQRSKSGYRFCGDNQWQWEIVPEDSVLAVVTGYVKKGKVRSLSEPGYRIYKMLMIKGFGIRKYYITLRRRIGRICRDL